MHFHQRALIFSRADLEFGEKYLDVMLEDGSQSTGFSVEYSEIGFDQTVQSMSELAVGRLGLVLIGGSIIVGVLTGGQPQGMAAGFNWLCFIAGLILFASMRYARFDATVILLSSGNRLIVFHDGQQKEILDEIDKRRRSDLRRLARYDALMHPEVEMHKLRYLKKHGVVSEAEFEELRSRIESQPVAR